MVFRLGPINREEAGNSVLREGRGKKGPLPPQIEDVVPQEALGLFFTLFTVGLSEFGEQTASWLSA